MRSTLTLALVLLFYGLLASWQARNTAPWENEAWFADPALNLLNKGFMGTTILESKGTWMEGMDRHTYWILPLYVLTQAAWYKVFGFSLLTLRWLSIFWGAIVLLAWYPLLRRLAPDPKVALLAVGLLTIDYHFVGIAALGRMDVMCAGLGWAGVAAYVCLRERNLLRAMFYANALVAASCLTHPCGALYFALLAILTLFYDRTRLGWKDAAAAAAPYLAGMGAWGIYIAQDPAHFLSQFSGNISGIASEFAAADRWAGLKSPFRALFAETVRYLAVFDWYTATNFWTRFQVGILALYALGILWALVTSSIRTQAGYRVLLLSGFVFYFVLAIFEGIRSSTYVVHTLPIAAALLAVSIVHTMQSDRESGWVRAGALTVLAVFSCLQITYGIRNNLMPVGRWDYSATVEFLANIATPSSRITGSAEIAFERGFDSLIDDPRLGYYSGKRADFIVANRVYRGWFELSKDRYPEIHSHIQRLLRTDYRVVFQNTSYTVYQRYALP